MSKPPGADGEQDTGRYRRAPRHQRLWGLLIEDEFKTGAATLVQNAFRASVATLFYVGASAVCDILVHGRELASGHHPTLILSNHKRDLDSVVLPAVTLLGQGLRRPNQRLVYAIREDAFWPDFLEGYLHWRGPFRLSVKPYLRLLKAYPMGYVTKRADLPRIASQLQTFASLLDRGRDLYWTPEGGLSLDGRLGRFRAGFFRLVDASHAPLNMLPVAICYDSMTTRRTRCFIRFGPEVAVDRSLSKHDIERQVRLAILRQMTVNAGHLLVAALRDVPAAAQFHRSELEERLLGQARRLRQADLALDPRLTMRWSFERRVTQLLRYADREQILEQRSGLWTVARGVRHPAIEYVANELADMEAALGVVNPS